MRGDALRTALDFAELPSTTDRRDSEPPYSPRPARSDPAAVLRTDEVASPIKGWSPCVSDVPRRKTVLQHKRPRVGTVRPAAKGENRGGNGSGSEILGPYSAGWAVSHGDPGSCPQLPCVSLSSHCRRCRSSR